MYLDEDECLNGTDACSNGTSTCSNTDGSYDCICNDGFVLLSDNRTCEREPPADAPAVPLTSPLVLTKYFCL